MEGETSMEANSIYTEVLTLPKQTGIESADYADFADSQTLAASTAEGGQTGKSSSNPEAYEYEGKETGC
jgi:hypothetical protein